MRKYTTGRGPPLKPVENHRILTVLTSADENLLILSKNLVSVSVSDTASLMNIYMS